MLIGLNFFEKNNIIRNIISWNKNYYTDWINQDFLYSLHTKMIKLNFWDYFSDRESLLLIWKVKWFYTELLKFKKILIIKKNMKNLL